MTTDSIRGEAGRFATLGVTLETRERIKQLAGDKPLYRYIGELIEREAANRQMRLGPSFPSSGGKSGKENVIARLTRIFGTERGRDVLAKMELAHWDDEDREHVCAALLEADLFGLADTVLIGLQNDLNERLKLVARQPALGLQTSEA